MYHKEIDSDEAWVEAWRKFVGIRAKEEGYGAMSPEVADLLRRLMESVFIVHSELANTDLSVLGIEPPFAVMFSNNPMAPILLEFDTHNEPIGYILFVAVEFQFLSFYLRLSRFHEVNNFFHAVSNALSLSGITSKQASRNISKDKIVVLRGGNNESAVVKYVVERNLEDSYIKCVLKINGFMKTLAAELNEPMPKTAISWMEET